jgi:hypothetical protein
MSEAIMNDGPMGADAIAAAVREALDLGPSEPLAVTEITRHTNVNYVYRVAGDGISIFVKHATSKLKAFDITAPRSRVVREAMSAIEFRRVCGHLLEIPNVVFLDERRSLVGLESVGAGGETLHDALRADYASFAAGGETWGTALGTLARATRVRGPLAPADRPLSQTIWLGMMASGAARLFREAIPGLLQPTAERAECLIHNDLWGKNIVVGRGRCPAVLDFEAAGIGDPAVDVASLLATMLIPVLADGADGVGRYACFVGELAQAYVSAAGDASWGHEVLRRAYHLVSAGLALRAVGISPYPMSPRARELTALTSQALFRERPADAAEFVRVALRAA